ncbi:MAG TPA: hypothetical protein GX725_04730, partial [Mollicutes bacterium]|nr:hypothetical protein [Mollicutes bacterium]
LRLGNGKYKLYTSPVTVRSNMQVSAYYVTYEGERSNTAYRRVRNIKTNNKPYLEVDADPYPYPNSYGNNSVTVTLNYSDADRVEYSLDGVVFKPYTNSFSVSQNIRVYGRATNQYGTTERYLDITNIGDMKAPTPREKLSVTITAVPEPVVSKTPTDKVLVMINYDNKATEKYYSLGKYGPLVEYTGEFEVTENTTIYAYALSDNGRGQTSKKIDNLSRGISEPNIIGNPSNNVQTSKTKITIEYDKNATIKRYSVNGGSLRDYVGSFDVAENGEIYATSSNALGEVSDATYEVANIVSPPPTFIIDKGDYFILKLNYPPNSKVREYKFTNEGSWKTYKEDGILLIKAKYKDKLLNNKNELKIKVENELGEKVVFNGDWYVLTSLISNLQDNIFMRWDRSIPPTPQIIPNTIEAAREVELTIMYNDALLKKQYKVVGPDGEMISDYGPYKEKIKVTRKNTIIYARGQDDAEVWSLEGIYKVTNIDEEQPVIKLTMDLETKTTQLGIKVSVTDDVRVSKVKWAKGILGESYFKTKGVEVQNNSVVNIAENDYYTFYAEDGVGNKQVYTINVENIDLTPPSIEITATPDKAVGVESTIAIDYGDATTKQYKIGNSAVWINYTSPFKITSYTVLSNNVHNDDGTVTIYAKGKDSVGNEIVVTKKIVNLDLDMPKAPTITSSAGYPVLKSYGVDLDATTTITYDNRSDIDNFYSLDNGVTWLTYKGEFQSLEGTIKAKSVKRDTGLTAEVTKQINMPTDALKSQAYDGNDSTRLTDQTNKYMKVDPSMHGKKIRVLLGHSYKNPSVASTIRFLNENKVEISNVVASSIIGTFERIYTIPVGTVWIKYESERFATYNTYLYEIEPSNEPTFSVTNGYMLLHADPTKAIRSPYQMVSINYFPTSVQRLYRIGDTGEWLNYEDKPVWVNQGETIYSKGIDKYGNETRLVSNYTVNVTDSITSPAYDGNPETYFHLPLTSQYKLRVDSSMQGKKIVLKAKFDTSLKK